MGSELDLQNCTLDKIHHPHWTELHIAPLAHVWHLIFAYIGLFVFVGSFIGNTLVFILFVRFKSLRSRSNLFVLNLTAADFLLCVGNIPMFIIASFSGYWVFDVFGCHAYAFIGSVASFVSINTLAAIAVDRCLVIVKIMKLHNRPSRTYFYVAIAIIWIYSVMWGAVPIGGWGKYILEGTNTSCTFDFLTRSVSNRLYVTTIFLAHFVVPVSIIACSYYLIFQTVSKHRREFDKAARIFGEERVPFSVRKHNNGMKKELKTAKVSIIVILVFCVSWFPYATVALIGEFGDPILVTRLASGIPCLCAKFSTVVNPLIYALLHPKFRVRLFSLSSCCELNRLQNHSSIRRDTIWCRSLRMSEQNRLSQIEESNTV